MCLLNHTMGPRRCWSDLSLSLPPLSLSFSLSTYQSIYPSLALSLCFHVMSSRRPWRCVDLVLRCLMFMFNVYFYHLEKRSPCLSAGSNTVDSDVWCMIHFFTKTFLTYISKYDIYDTLYILWSLRFLAPYTTRHDAALKPTPDQTIQMNAWCTDTF